MFTRILLGISCLLIGPLSLSLLPAAAVCPQPDPRVNAEFFKSDTVFTGRVVLERVVPDQGDTIGGWIYRLRVAKTFKGARREYIEVYTENSSARFPLVVGEEYLLFAYLFQGRFTIDGCGNSAVLSTAGNAIHQILQIRKATRGKIEGRLVNRLEGAPPSGIRIIIRGERQTYTTVTDRDGWFRLHVPPGRYSAHAESPQWSFTPFELSYDDPNDFIVHRGGCAQLQLVATPK